MREMREASCPSRDLPGPTALAVRTLVLAALTGCVHTRQATGPILQFPPVTITAGDALDRELAQLNAAELFAKGRAAYGASDFALAARCFTRGADFFPDDPLHAALSYNAGLALMQEQQWNLAYERFHILANAKTGTGDALDAALQEATCDYMLDDYAAAASILGQLTARTDIPETQRLSAEVDLGVCQVEESLLTEGEHSLRDALRAYTRDQTDQRMPEDVAAKAEFFLGEIYKIYFSAVKLDPAHRSVDELATDLEEKAEELLSAQGHYLRAIRIGSPHWATGAGYRIGSLYEELYDAMVTAPIPADLDAEEAEVYREELRKRIRVLVTKAINIYDQTLAAASRIGEDNPFVAQTHDNLERMKKILLDDPKEAEATSAAAGEPDGGAGKP